MCKQNRETLRAFQLAWAEQDINAMMELVSDDIKYHASIGPEPGQTWIGKKAVRAGIMKMLNHDDKLVAVNGEPIFFNNRAFCGWIYTGDTREIGCDLFTFVDGKIAVKDAYRKCRS